MAQEDEAQGFLHLPSATGTGVLVRRTQVVGARPNGPNEGSIVYTAAGPSIYTSLTTKQLARLFDAQAVEAQYQG